MRHLMLFLIVLALSGCGSRQREQEGGHTEAIDSLAADTSTAALDTTETNTGDAPVPPSGH